MKRKLVEFKRNYKEEGLSLVEVLVAVLLLSIVSVMVVMLINTTMNSASRFSNVTTTQAEVSNAASVIQRDLSTAQAVTKASNNSVTLQIRTDNKDYEVTYFAYDPANPGTLPSGVNTSTLPTYPAVIQLRKPVGAPASSTSQTIVVKGLNQTGFSDTSKHNMFNYYDSTNTEVGVPDSTTGDSASQSAVATIKRVEFRIAANAAGRGTPIQIESSASINASNVSPSSVPGGGTTSYDSIPDCTAQFKVSIDPVNSPRRATLTWYPSAGATSYTIYRQNVNTGTLENSTIIPNPTTRQYVDNGPGGAGLAWGTTYMWSMQVNGPGGTTGICANTQGTIIPAEITFTNINSLATSLTATKNGSGAEALTRPAETNIPAKTVNTTNILSGNRYTVARDLINQLSWQTTYGTVGYRIYYAGDLSTPVATISTAGTQFTQLSSVYGADRTYVVRAYNAGGESLVSTGNQVRLISPPLASPFYSSDPGTSVRSATTDTNFTYTRANNTTGFRAYKNEIYAPSTNNGCSPSSWAANPSLNFVGNDPISDTKAAWGSNTCYKFVPFNDAGNGVSLVTSTLHNPGKFTFTVVSNPSTMRIIDEGRNVDGGWGGANLPYCWSDRNGNAGSIQDYNCAGDSQTARADAYDPIGMFGRVSNSRLSIYVEWNQATNSYNDYNIRRQLIQSGNIIDQNPDLDESHNIPYVSGNQAVKFNNEQPGAIYRFTVTGTATNGLTRTRTTETLTRPDIPASMLGNYWHRQNLENGTLKGTKTIVNANLGAAHGMIDSLRWVSDFPGWYGGTRTDWISANGSNANLSSNYQTQAGKNYRGLSTWVTRNITVVDGSYGQSTRVISMTSSSDEIGRFGELTGVSSCPRGGSGDCWSGDGASYAWGWPTWWTGGPARYWAGGGYVDGWIEVGNQAEVNAPPFTPGDGTDGTGCAGMVENDPEFSTNCAYGTGIPPAPTVTITQSGTNQTATWNVWNAISSYQVSYQVGANPVQNVTRTPSNRTLTVTVPVGQQLVVSVVALNATNQSSAGTATKVTAPAAPTNVTATKASANSINVGWTASSGATSYRVIYTKNGGAPVTVTATSNPFKLTGLGQGTYVIRVVAIANGATSPASASKTVVL